MRWLALLILLAAPAAAQDIRVATFNASLSRGGPGVLLKDIRKLEDPQILAVAEVIRRVRPDILVLNEIDYDGSAAALGAMTDLLAAGPDGIAYPHSFFAPSNTGEPSGLDLDDDGERTGPADAHGYGSFPGQYGMAVLSRFPLDPLNARTFRTLLWKDVPGALLPVRADGSPFPSAQAHEALRLSSKSHWDVPVDTPQGPLHLYISHPTPPVFDGPEDFNGRRNHDEITFWTRYIDGAAVTDDAGRTGPRTAAPFVVLGDLNADPSDGDGLREGIRSLLTHPALTDPEPTSDGGPAAAATQGGANATHKGDPALDTADWNDSGPGNLRVDFVLPSAALTVTGAGVHWPAPDAPGAEAATLASDHRLVWVDLRLP